MAQVRGGDFLFTSRLRCSAHLSTRQYTRNVKAWVKAINLDPTMYGTHTLRHKILVDLSQDQKSPGGALLLGHTKLESTVRYLGIEVDDGRAD